MQTQIEQEKIIVYPQVNIWEIRLLDNSIQF